MAKKKFRDIKDLTKSQQNIIKLVRAWLKKSSSGFPTLTELKDELEITHQHLRTNFGSLSSLKGALIQLGFGQEIELAEQRWEDKGTKNRIIDAAISLLEELSRYPTINEMREYKGISREAIRRYFGGIGGLCTAIEKEHSDIFEDLFTTQEFTKENLKLAKDSIKGQEDFLITTAVSGCRVHRKAYDAVVNWENDVGGLTLYQPIADPARPQQGQHMFFDPQLKDEHFIFNDIDINNKIHISSLLTSAKQLNPHTGLRSICDREGITFVAAPKQVLTPLANMSRMPGYIFSPGAITVSDYTTELYMSNRTAYIAERKHHLGGAIVRVLGPNKYFFTNVEFDLESGEFAHLGKLYTSTGVKDINTKYMVLADLHSEELDEKAFEGVLAAIDYFRPEEIFLHDCISFCTINPFDARRPLLVAHARKALGQSILDSTDLLMRRLNKLHAVCGSKLMIVRGNHDAFLDMWVEKGSYMKDPINFEIGHELASAKLRHEHLNALEYVLKSTNPDVKWLFDKVEFLSEISSVRRYGVECGQHGRWGSQGSGNPNLGKCVEELGPCNMGHGHTSEIHPKGGMRVGQMLPTNPHERVKYARKGPSKNSQSFIVGYVNGQRQLIHLINSEFNLGEGE